MQSVTTRFVLSLWFLSPKYLHLIKMRIGNVSFVSLFVWWFLSRGDFSVIVLTLLILVSFGLFIFKL